MISGNQWEFMENQSTNTIIGNGELSSILVYRTGGYLLVHNWNCYVKQIIVLIKELGTIEMLA